MTAAQAVVRVRQLVRDLRGGTYDSGHVISALNEAIQVLHQHLSNLQSSLIYSTQSLQLAEGVREYDINAVTTDIDGVRIDGNTVPLQKIFEHDLMLLGDDGTLPSEPRRYYLTPPDETGRSKIGFSPIPDRQYTATVYYRPAPVLLTSADTTPLPFGGVWDTVMCLMAAMDLRDTMEGDISYLLARYQMAYNQAMRETLNRGLRPLHSVTDMFSLRGV